MRSTRAVDDHNMGRLRRILIVVLGTALLSGTVVASPYQAVVAEASEISHDGDAFVYWRPGNGGWYAKSSDGVELAKIFGWGRSGDVPLIGDVDNDGDDDFVFWRPSNGRWFAKNSDGDVLMNYVQWGRDGDIPLIADVNHDGRDDLVFWRPSNGRWFAKSTTGQVLVNYVQWGKNGDIPLIADVNRDGRDDFVVWRPSNGRWYVKTPQNQVLVNSVQWGGQTGDVPLIADVNNDGRDDFVIWRPSSARWYAKSAQSQVLINSIQWGRSTDVPLIADVNHDGRDDFVLWRPADGRWFGLSTGGQVLVNSVQSGRSGDVPLIADKDIRPTCLGKEATVDMSRGETPTGGTDVIFGTPGNDTISVFNGETACGGGGNDRIYVYSGLRTRVDGGAGNDTITVTSQASLSSETNKVVIYGGSGADTISLTSNSNSVEVFGGSGNDVINGGPSSDRLFGEGGADTIHSYGGTDTIDGGAGDDLLRGGDADDTIHGGSGDDRLDGQAGHDIVHGDTGNDSIWGGSGHDRLYGDDGDDWISGQDGSDTIYGGKWADTLLGGNDPDTLYGEGGDDNLNGGAGVDTLDGGWGTDLCHEPGTSCEVKSDNSPPTDFDFRVETSGTQYLIVKWDPSSDNVGVANYKLLVDGQLDTTFPSSARHATIGGRVQGETYEITMYATDEQGNESTHLSVSNIAGSGRTFSTTNPMGPDTDLTTCSSGDPGCPEWVNREISLASAGDNFIQLDWCCMVNYSVVTGFDVTIESNTGDAFTKFVDNSTTSIEFGSQFSIVPGRTYTVTVYPTDTGWRRTEGLTTTLTHLGSWQASEATTAPCGGVGEPPCPPVPQWDDDSELQVASLSPYSVRVEWPRVLSGTAIDRFVMQAVGQQSSTLEIDEVSGTELTAELPTTLMTRGESMTLSVVAIDVNGGESAPLTTDVVVPNWNQLEEQNPDSLGSAPIYGPPPIGWIVREGGVANASADVGTDGVYAVPALYTGNAVDADGIVSAAALFGADVPTSFTMAAAAGALQTLDYPVRENVELSQISFWDLGGGRVETFGTRLACMRLSEDALGIVDGLPTSSTEGRDDVTICRHLAGIDESFPGATDWWVRSSAVAVVRGGDSGFGRTIATTDQRVFEGCRQTIQEIQGDHQIFYHCDFRVVGGYSVGFGLSEAGGPTLGMISDVAACDSIPVQVFHGTASGIVSEHGFDPCAEAPGYSDSEEQQAVRLARVLEAAPQVEYLFTWKFYESAYNDCLNVCSLEVTSELSRLFQEEEQRFRYGGGCNNLPYGFNEQVCGAGFSWDWLIEAAVDVIAGIACGIFVTTTSGAGTVACGAMAAMLAGIVGNLAAGRAWDDGIFLDGAIGAGSALAFKRIAEAFQSARSLRLAGNACASFSGDTQVLLADGVRIDIAEVEVGDFVWATNPATGESGPRQVAATWPHEDTLFELELSTGSIATTEDHRFWNVTDGEWQEAQTLDIGDVLGSADDSLVTVEGFDWTSSGYSAAYDLTVDDLHTFYVSSGNADVLVHNSCGTISFPSNTTLTTDEIATANRLIQLDEFDGVVLRDFHAETGSNTFDYVDQNGNFFDQIGGRIEISINWEDERINFLAALDKHFAKRFPEGTGQLGTVVVDMTGWSAVARADVRNFLTSVGDPARTIILD